MSNRRPSIAGSLVVVMFAAVALCVTACEADPPGSASHQEPNQAGGASAGSAEFMETAQDVFSSPVTDATKRRVRGDLSASVYVDSLELETREIFALVVALEPSIEADELLRLTIVSPGTNDARRSVELIWNPHSSSGDAPSGEVPPHSLHVIYGWTEPDASMGLADDLTRVEGTATDEWMRAVAEGQQPLPFDFADIPFPL